MRVPMRWLRDVAVALASALLIILFVYQPVRVEGYSMMPRVANNERLVINKFIYHFTSVNRGDVVVFHYPLNPYISFIKRVIGLPGDRIEVRQKKVFVNGKPLSEPYVQYLQPFVTDEPTRDVLKEIVVPPGDYFVMGDNRDDSYDSRFWGFVRENKILGKAEIIYWSWNNVSHSVRFSRIGQKIR